MTREKKLKIAILASGFRCYQVASALGISACTLSVWLRAPMSKEHERKIKSALQAMRAEKGLSA